MKAGTPFGGTGGLHTFQLLLRSRRALARRLFALCAAALVLVAQWAAACLGDTQAQLERVYGKPGKCQSFQMTLMQPVVVLGVHHPRSAQYVRAPKKQFPISSVISYQLE